MDIRTVLAIAFVLVFSIVLYLERRKIQVQSILGPFLYFALVRTKLGLKFMDRFAKGFRTPLRWAGYLGVVVGFAGMGLIAFELVRTTITILTSPESAPGVGLVLPIQAKGVFFVPFEYWILSIFAIVVIHEASHGILARVHNIPVKSSGFAAVGVLLPVIPAAFVEPDEVELPKRPKWQQLSVFAAGPFSNVVTGFVFLLILTQLFTPAVASFYDFDGITITSVTEGGAAAVAGISAEEYIVQIEDTQVTDAATLTSALGELSPGDTATVVTDKGEYEVVMGGEDSAVLGVMVDQHTSVKEGVSSAGAAVFSWFMGLFYWLFLLSFGIGLFNLVPLGPIDGGKMFQLAAESVSKKYGGKLWGAVSFLFLGLIVFNIFAGFVL